MNRIKIIKHANLQSLPERSETKVKKAGPAVTKRQAVQVVAGWIDEWRNSKPKDGKRAFADLFGSSPTAIC